MGDIRATHALLQGQRLHLLKAFRNSGRGLIRLTGAHENLCGAILRSTDIEDGPVPCPPALDHVTWGLEILGNSSGPPII
jgi:hypothetical protein